MLSYGLSPLRIFASGDVEGVAHLRKRLANRIFHKRTSITGRVTQVSRTGDLTVATVEARSGTSVFKFQINNFPGQPDLVKGTGTIRFQGKTYRVKIDNQTTYPQAVKVR